MALNEVHSVRRATYKQDQQWRTARRRLWRDVCDSTVDHRRLSAQWMGLEEAEQVYFPYWMDVYPFRPPEHGFLDFHV